MLGITFVGALEESSLCCCSGRAQRYLDDAEVWTKTLALQHIAFAHDPTIAPAMAPFGRWVWPPDQGVLAMAQGVDGDAVVQKLIETRATARPFFRALVARVHEHREALRDWARTKRPRAPTSLAWAQW